MLNQAKLARAVRHTYAEAVERYLDYCLGHGLPVRVESARGFVDDALRRQLTGEGDTWEQQQRYQLQERYARDLADCLAGLCPALSGPSVMPSSPPPPL